MARDQKSNVSILVALAGLPAMVLLVRPNPARAQYQVGGNGHALDANNQVGSGGYNGGGRNQQGGSQQLQPGGFNGTNLNDNGAIHGNINNNVVYGNVSGLNGFQGRVRSFDPTEFQGNTGTAKVDRLDAISAPVNYAQRTTGSPTYTPYYSTSNYAPTPNSAASTPLVQTPGGVGYIPAPVINPLIPSEDVRVVPVNQDPNVVNTIPAPGELNVAGPVDPAGNASLYSMSPLYGVRQMDNLTSPGGDTFYQSRENQSALPANERQRLTPYQIQAMREELNKTVVTGENSPNGQGTGTPADGTNGAPANGTNGAPANGGSPAAAPGAGATNLDQSGSLSGQPLSTQLQSQALNTQIPATPAASGDLNTGAGLQNQLIVPAAQQSRQLKALEDKYAKIKHLTDVEATEKFNRENQIHNSASPNNAAKNTAKGSALAPGAGLLDQSPMHDHPSTQPSLKPMLTPKDNPVSENQNSVITSLATGIPAKGLADLMKSAEDKMREGKFTEAVDTYETAQAVAPNNPFVALGRSFAELGASYYGKADQDLTRAIIADPAVLAGKYDLNGFLGEDRVKFLVSDLTDLAAHQKSARPMVLLAFIAHNTGDDNAAAKDLDQAAARGQYDSLVALMRSTWGVKVNGK
jgi:hypothetical protein